MLRHKNVGEAEKSKKLPEVNDTAADSYVTCEINEAKRYGKRIYRKK